MSDVSSVGMNLAVVNYYSTEFPFIDRMKSASGWLVNGYDPSLIPLNSSGYPSGLPAGASDVYTMVGMDPANSGQVHTYVLSYKGAANFILPGGKVISSEPGKITFEYLYSNNMMPLIINGLDAGSPLSAVSIVRSDQQALFEAGEIFNPNFTDKIQAFDTLRYMDWMATNENTAKSWSDRTHVSDRTWQAVGNSTVPIEVIVALANKTKTNAWINIPTQADDDYVRQMLKYVHDNLDPSLAVKVEYSNEVWNWSFQQAQYAQREGSKLWGTDANGDGVINPDDPAEQLSSAWVEYYGYRSAQIANIGNQIFSDGPDRLQNVLATQTAYTGLEAYILGGVNRANLGTAGSLFDDYAITTYFGGSLRAMFSEADRATILGWARSGEAGVTAGFAAIKDGTGITSEFSLSDLPRLYAYQAAVANKYGLKLVAYEGGLDVGAGAFGDDRAEVLAYFQRLQADPRMADMYNQMLNDFSAAGGTLANSYIDTQADNYFGMFGTMETIYDNGSPAWDALVAAQQAVRGGKAPGTPTPEVPTTPPASPTLPTGFTDKTNYTMAADEKSVAYVGSGAFTATGNALDNTITAGAGGSNLSGGLGVDVLIGGAGADLLDGGTGADTMIGNGGDDIYVVDNAGDAVVEKAGSGTDEVRTTLASYTLDTEVENLTYVGTAAFTGTGNASANVLNGGDGGAKLYGGAGDDRLNGGRGADMLDGGAGNDVMSGGAGDDVYIVDAAGDQVIEATDGGIDEVRTTLATYTLPDRVEKLVYVGVNGFTGTGNQLANTIMGGSGVNQLYGGGGNDQLTGGAANDLLDGGTGDDVLTGGAGNDVYLVDTAGDRIVELAGQGTDEVKTALGTYTLGDNLENLTYVGTGAFTGTGNAFANVITAGSGGSHLYGGDGADTLTGGTGGDYLDGGAGIDRMVGGAGNDVYVVDDYRDTIVEEKNGGTDEIRTAMSAFVLTGEMENLTYTGTGSFQAIGNAFDNVMVGGAGSNRLLGGDGKDTLIGGGASDTLDGGNGADRMTGGGGNDIYFVDNAGDVVVEDANGGLDTVYSSITHSLSANVENLLLFGGNAIDGTGNEIGNTIVGNGGVNRLMGGGGNDVLYGGGGSDMLDGGDGDDTMVGDDGADTLYGGAGDDALVGGSGDDVLVGGAGVDSLTGGSGADRFVFGPGDLGGNASKTDTISDFAHDDGDKIDLSAFDSDLATIKRDAFTFVGSAGFSKRAGELRVGMDTTGAYQVISGDLNGDGVADFSINVSKTSALIASDFVL